MKRSAEFTLQLEKEQYEHVKEFGKPRDFAESNYDLYAKYAPWIDVLLALRQIARTIYYAPIVPVNGRPVSISTDEMIDDFAYRIIPSDVIGFIARMYFDLTTPTISTSDEFAIMSVHGRDLITWTLLLSQKQMFICTGAAVIACERQVAAHIPEPVEITCGSNFVIAWTPRGRYCWGCNMFGQLGIGTTSVYEPSGGPIYRESPLPIISVSAGVEHAMMIYASAYTAVGSPETFLIGWGNNEGCLGGGLGVRVDPCHIVEISNPLSISCRLGYSLVLTRDGVYEFSNDFSTTAPVKVCTHNDFIALQIPICCLPAMSLSLSPSGKYHYAKSLSSHPYIAYFRSMLSRRELLILSAHDPKTLPGRLLSIYGGIGYVVILTTRGVYTYVAKSYCESARALQPEDVEVRLICPL